MVLPEFPGQKFPLIATKRILHKVLWYVLKKYGRRLSIVDYNNNLPMLLEMPHQKRIEAVLPSVRAATVACPVVEPAKSAVPLAMWTVNPTGAEKDSTAHRWRPMAAAMDSVNPAVGSSRLAAPAPTCTAWVGWFAPYLLEVGTWNGCALDSLIDPRLAPRLGHPAWEIFRIDCGGAASNAAPGADDGGSVAAAGDGG